MRTPLLPLAVIQFLACVVPTAIAAPLRPGLWEMSIVSKNSIDEETRARIKKLLADASPERRKGLEAELRKKGQDLNAYLQHDDNQPNKKQLCFTPEMMKAFDHPQDSKGCAVKRSVHTDGNVETSVSCKDSRSTSSAHMKTIGRTAYISDFVIDAVLNDGSTVHASEHTAAKWLQNECGDVKPVPFTK